MCVGSTDLLLGYVGGPLMHCLNFCGVCQVYQPAPGLCRWVSHFSHIDIITLTLLRGWWGRCEKKLSPEGGRKGGWRKKARAARPPDPGLEPGTCRVLGEGPQLHARGAV